MDVISRNEIINPTEWSNEYTFPLQPRAHNISELHAYLLKLKPGVTLAYKDDAPKLIVKYASMPKHEPEITVLCEREGIMCEREGYFPWSIIKIIFINGRFVYSKNESFLEESEAETEFLQLNKSSHIKR